MESGNVPGLRIACHSPSVFWTGKFSELAIFALEPNKAPKNGIVGIGRKAEAF